ncbi:MULTISPECIES: SMR family transporter [Aquitalea]|uniref:QacE family quaternary ammonium compound efflux SMR transporter n=2 Tax=Aquitalea TaxID=407217 RepID=A0A454JMH4_9NEIS|nr:MULTISPECIES: SMR family transporter [Aquitalea]MBA4710047.1 QacE family quaternary ammonium compound efflux SMR transporter [Aquitalea magnusonii]RMD01266.1 QacE family quaternary ammonium compound efflux SMR transporter [Aquitalea palustris]
MNNAWIFLSVAILSEVVATSSMKLTEGFTRLGPSLVTAIGYMISFYMLSLTLRHVPVGVVYAIWSGVGIVLVSLVAWQLYGQKLDVPAMIGIGMIMGGVLVLNLFSKSSSH